MSYLQDNPRRANALQYIFLRAVTGSISAFLTERMYCIAPQSIQKEVKRGTAAIVLSHSQNTPRQDRHFAGAGLRWN